ncbi:MAG: hypothetical protein ACLTGG_05880 [Subdoligranulum sp.]
MTAPAVSRRRGNLPLCAGAAHGTVNLRGALEQSCNCYFIALGQLLGGQAIECRAELWPWQPGSAGAGAEERGGELPSAADLQNAGSLASFPSGRAG